VPSGIVYLWKSTGRGTYVGQFLTTISSDWNIIGP
jgi:hypothetical protein